VPLHDWKTVTDESFSSLGIRGEYETLLAKSHSRFSMRTIKVKTRRLDTIIANFALTKLDVLAVDVEGWELECLRGFSFGALAPKVAIIENLHRHDAGLTEFMKQHGYELWRNIEPNDIYLKT